MRALVTGGGGFLGRYVVEQLLARGDEVRILARGEYPEVAALGAECVRGDLRDAETVAAACADRDVVFHVAAVPGVWGPRRHYFETNVLGTRHVLAGCRRHGVGRLVFTSSPSVVYDGRAHEGADESLPYPARYLCRYPETKALAEREVLEADGRDGLSTCALRPHLVWGPRDNHLLPRLVQAAKSGRLVQVGDGRNRVSMSYVENAARAHLQAADALGPGSPVAGQAYFVNDPEPVLLWETLGRLLDLAQVARPRRAIPYRAAWCLGAVLEAVYATLRLKGEPRMTRFVAAQLATSHWYDVGKARRDFGYDPPVPFEQALRRTAPDLRRWGEGEAG